MVKVIPDTIDVRPNSIAIVAWDEGTAGLIHSWIGDIGHHVPCFVNAADDPPNIDIDLERPKREAKKFDFPTKDSFKGLPLISALDWPDVVGDFGITKALVVPPDLAWRLENIELARKKGLELISAVHPTATILEDAIIHENVVLYPRAFVGYRSELYPGTVINTGFQIDHHNVIHPCVQVDPGVVTAGNVVMERFARIHTGAKIINNMRLGEGAIIGAGAVIIEDVPPRTTVVGVPGCII